MYHTPLPGQVGVFRDSSTGTCATLFSVFVEDETGMRTEIARADFKNGARFFLGSRTGQW